ESEKRTTLGLVGYLDEQIERINTEIKEIDRKQSGVEQSTKSSDHDELERLSNEYEDLERQKKASDLKRRELEKFKSRYVDKRGRVRNQDEEKDRVAVHKTIHYAINRIGSIHKALKSHLEKAIKTGVFCRYNPPEEVTWL
ncbi:unnamed protein product, partial [marine sediment metagenome]